MSGMRLGAQRVEDDDVEAIEQGEARVRNAVHVSEVGGVAEAIAGDFEVSVHERHRSKGNAGDIDRAIEAEQLNPRACGVGRVGREGVGEDAFEHFGCGLIGVQGQLPVAMREAQGAEVVETEDVIGVRVGVEDGIDVADAEAQRLLAEIRAGVDEDAVRTRWFLLGLPFDGDGGAEALVAQDRWRCRRGRCSRGWARPWRCRCRGRGCWR